MWAKPVCTNRKRASAERGVRALGATLAMGIPVMRRSQRSSQGVFWDPCLRKAMAADAVRTGLAGSAGIAGRALLVVWNALHLLQPGGRLGVAGGPVIAARGERASRANLRGIGHTGPLKLADLEETPGEYTQPVLDVANAVLMPIRFWDIRPVAESTVAPGTVGEEGDLWRGIAQTGGVIHVEIVQLVGADDGFGLLTRLVSCAITGDKFWTHFRRQNILQHGAGPGAPEGSIGQPANEELDQGLGNTGVDVVVRHVIAHPVGRPAERQFTQVTGSQDQRIVIVRQAEEVACPLTGLDVLESHIIHHPSPRIGMVQVAQHLLAARTNVNFVGLTADSLHEGTGIGQRARTRGKARH